MSRSEFTKVGEVQGFVIEFNPSRGMFHVDYTPKLPQHSEDSIQRDYDTYAKATEGINSYVKTKTKKQLQVQLKAITDYGRKVTISGVHMKEGHILFDRETDNAHRRHDEHLYPVVPWVDGAIRELLRLEKRVQELHAAIDMVRITTEKKRKDPYAGYDSARTRSMEENTKLLLANYEAVTKQAQRLGDVETVIARLKKREKEEARQKAKRRGW